MKNMIRTIILVLFSAVVLTAQNSDNTRINSTVNKLFDLCKNDNYEQVALLIAYSGKDAQRDMKASYNYKNSKEAAKVKRIAKKIKAFLNISDKYTIGDIKSEKTGEVTNYTVEVLFVSGSQELKTQFTFVEAGNKLLMADLN